MADTPNITELANLLGVGDDAAASKLLPVVYGELRALAGAYLRDRPPGHTLQPTALVHEAYVRLAGNDGLEVQSRAHFFAISAKAMRRVLADHARAKNAAKRGGGAGRITLSGVVSDDNQGEYDAADVDEALEELSALNERQGQIVEMRFFAGLTIEQVAQVLGVSKRTVDLDWNFARAWLRTRLSEKG